MTDTQLTFTKDDAVKALWLMRRYNVEFIMRYHSSAQGRIISLGAYERALREEISGKYPADYIQGLCISEGGFARLNALPAAERDALKMLDLWPEEKPHKRVIPSEDSAR